MSADSVKQTANLNARTWLVFRVLLYIGLVALAVAVLIPSLGHRPEVWWRSRCRGNVKQIMLALHNYHDTYQALPPPYTTDVKGQKLHSWRTLILPYLGSDESIALYDELRLSEPWNSPHNIEVENRFRNSVSKCFHCLSDPRDDQSPHEDASYLAVVGPRTVWSIDRPLNFSDIVDGTPNTIAVVEVADSGVHWMEPRDLHMDQMSLEINGLRGQGLSSYHETESRSKRAGGCHIGMMDGTCRWIHFTVSQATLRELLTIDDGHASSGWKKEIRRKYGQSSNE